MDVRHALEIAYAGTHDALREALDTIPAELLFWQPGPDLNHAGFLFWHVVRDEDAVVQGELMERPQLWLAEPWQARMGLQGERQGTGFSSGEVAATQYDPEVFRQYAEGVWRATAAAMESVADERLQAPIHGRPMLEHLMKGSIGHNWVHLGEVRAILGLRGWRFRE
jgi:hypothetical protein